MPTFDGHANFAASLVATAPSPASSGTTLTVTAAEGALFPAPATAGSFNVTIWPANAQPTSTTAEIARCTARATDVLTITRAQEGTSARTVVVGDQVALTMTAKLLTDLEATVPSQTIINVGGTGYTIPAGVKATRVRMWGGGGAGGGGTGGSSTGGVGGGGGAASYCEVYLTALGLGPGTVVVGGGGAGQGGNNPGLNGTATTFAIAGVTYTAPGGTGGLAGGVAGSGVRVNLGGAGGVVSTNGDLNASGESGSPGLQWSGTTMVSGKGGSTSIGAGGNAVKTDVAGNPGIGFGAGGAGACALTVLSAGRAGGNGTGGIILVEEYP